jgi:phospholipase/carboxylesterase
MIAELLTAAAPLQKAKTVALMLHGRGASAENMLAFGQSLGVADVAYLAPQAPGSSWYPLSFLAPLHDNEPALSRALAIVEESIAHVTGAGLSVKQLVLLGFSQGGCLALEYAARHALRYGGVIGLSAGLIGPPGTPRHYAGSLSGTPVFLGCSDIDAHIPLARVHETTEVLSALGGTVTERIYPNFGHAINADEIQHVGQMLTSLAQRPSLTRRP